VLYRFSLICDVFSRFCLFRGTLLPSHLFVLCQPIMFFVLRPMDGFVTFAIIAFD
jgi:hypothetical protein